MEKPSFGKRHATPPETWSKNKPETRPETQEAMRDLDLRALQYAHEHLNEAGSAIEHAIAESDETNFEQHITAIREAIQADTKTDRASKIPDDTILAYIESKREKHK